MATKVEVFGSVSRERSGSGCASSCGSSDARAFEACVSEGNTIEVDRDINSPVSWIDLLAGSGIVTLTFANLVASGGSFQARITSAFGTDQIFPIGDLLTYVSKTSGQEWTALAVRGAGHINGMLAGH